MDDHAKMELMSHIRGHVTYPATKKALLEACSNMGHVPAETTKWVAQTLPDQTYKTADEVIHALDLPHEH